MISNPTLIQLFQYHDIGSCKQKKQFSIKADANNKRRPFSIPKKETVMNTTRLRPTVKVPDPFDGSAHNRLKHMGIIDDAGQVRIQVMAVFSRIFAGVFFDDLRETHGADDLMTIYGTFKAIYIKADYHHMFLLMSIQYDYMGRPLPDPVWWLAGDSGAVTAFMSMFIKEYEHLMTSAGILKPGEEVNPV